MHFEVNRRVGRAGTPDHTCQVNGVTLQVDLPRSFDPTTVFIQSQGTALSGNVHQAQPGVIDTNLAVDDNIIQAGYDNLAACTSRAETAAGVGNDAVFTGHHIGACLDNDVAVRLNLAEQVDRFCRIDDDVGVATCRYQAAMQFAVTRWVQDDIAAARFNNAQHTQVQVLATQCAATIEVDRRVCHDRVIQSNEATAAGFAQVDDGTCLEGFNAVNAACIDTRSHAVGAPGCRQ